MPQTVIIADYYSVTQRSILRDKHAATFTAKLFVYSQRRQVMIRVYFGVMMAMHFMFIAAVSLMINTDCIKKH